MESSVEVEYRHLSVALNEEQFNEIDCKRKRGSSIDILAEAAASSISGQTSLSSTSDEGLDDCNKDDTSPLTQNPSNDKGIAESVGTPNIRGFTRPRGATISYSPFASKHSAFAEFELLGSSSIYRDNPSLKCLAIVADDEATTAELLSGLSTVKGTLSPQDPKEDMFSFGNLNFKPPLPPLSSVSNRRQSTNTHTQPQSAPNLTVSRYTRSSAKSSSNELDHSNINNDNFDGSEEFDDDENDEDGDLAYDVSILTAVANKMVRDDLDDSNSLLPSKLPTAGVHMYNQGRTRANSMPQLPSTVSIRHDCIRGAYTPEERRIRIERFLEKRRNRVWTKRVKYDVRKNFADSRVRVKGRFIRKQEEELLTATTQSTK